MVSTNWQYHHLLIINLFQFRLIVIVSLLQISLAVYQPQYQSQKELLYKQPIYPEPLYKEPLYKQPPVRILDHRQAQNHDGGFQFGFQAENGLSHQEEVAPDGSRQGGYSYVDPHGKTITVKYTAGKEGFRILQGDHIPPANVATSQTVPTNNDDGSYKPELYEAPYENEKSQQYSQAKPQQYYQPKPVYYQVQQQPAQNFKYVPQYAQSKQTVAYQQNAVEENYNEQQGKPHSFGAGYAFHYSS